MTTATSLSPSPWQERLNSFRPYAKGCAHSAVYGIFRRHGYIASFLFNHQHSVFLERKVTIGKAQSHSHKKQLIYVLKQVEELRKKMGIKKEVEVYFNPRAPGLKISSPAKA